MNKDIMRAAGFGAEVDMVEVGLCPTCDKKILDDSLRDEVSRKEFQISGMCQQCQDAAFGVGPT